MQQPSQSATITSLSHDGRGIAHMSGKTTFLDNGLPGEEVEFIYTKRHKNFDEGRVVTVMRPSLDRAAPMCPHFAVCGGCNLQHLSHAKQIAFKINVVQEMLLHFGGITIENMLPPIVGPLQGYRSRARLSVKYVQKKQRLLIGFHEKNGRYVADVNSCAILHPTVGTKIIALRDLVASLSIMQFIPQIEVACGETACALVLRHLQNFSAEDLEKLRAFEQEHKLHLYSQAGGPETVKPLFTQANLSYRLPEHNLELLFNPTDFTQINQTVNRQMVTRAIEQLELQPNEKVLDLFCGLGNFTLAIAKQSQMVNGVEGSNQAVTQAQINAKHNSCSNANFFVADLSKELPATSWAQQKYDKILLDPPRTGAQAICEQLKIFAARRIVYISCNPATLARDAKILVAQGYKLKRAGIIDMFPHTSHVETMSVWENY